MRHTALGVALVAMSCSRDPVLVDLPEASADASDSADSEDAWDSPSDPDAPVTRDPAFECPPADYVVTVDGPNGHEELRHYSGTHSVFGYSNDTPAAYDYIGRRGHFAIYASSSHSGSSTETTLEVKASPQGLEYHSQPTGTLISRDGDPIVTFTRRDPVGGIVEGTFSGDVLGGEWRHISGTFRVCHLPANVAFE